MTDNRDRNRAPLGATMRLLRLLLLLPNHRAEIHTAAAAFECDTNSIHQAALRLRREGVALRTLPPGPWNQWTGPATHYQIPEKGVQYAQALHELTQEHPFGSPHHLRPDPPTTN